MISKVETTSRGGPCCRFTGFVRGRSGVIKDIDNRDALLSKNIDLLANLLESVAFVLKASKSGLLLKLLGLKYK